MKKTALIIIDVQKGFDEPYWGNRNNPDAELNMVKLLTEWRKKDLPVIHVRHCSIDPQSPLHPELPGNGYKDEVKPLANEKQFSKSVNSAFIGTGLQDYLYEQSIVDLVVIGLTTDHCVSTTVRMAANLDFKVTLVADAVATFDRIGHDGNHYLAEDIHQIALVSLHNEFCHVVNTQEILKTVREEG